MNVLRVDNHVDNNSYTYVLCKRNVLVRCDADARAATAFVVFRFIVYLPLALRFSLYVARRTDWHSQLARSDGRNSTTYNCQLATRHDGDLEKS